MPNFRANIGDSNLTFPSQQDYSDRIGRAQCAMKKAGFDVLVLSGPDHHRFLSGLNGLPVGRPIWLVLPDDGAPAFVAPRSEAREISHRCDTRVGAEWIEWEEDIPSPMTHQEALAQYIAEIAPDARAIGVDFNATSAMNVELVKSALGAKRIKDATELLGERFAIKDGVAVDLIRRSADIVRHQFTECKNLITPGRCEWQLALASFVAATKRSAEWWDGDEEQSPFIQGMQMLGSGPHRTARCHSAGGGRVMRDGEIVEMCFCGPSIFGHAIGFDRPLHVGSKPISPELRRIIDVARAAQEAAVATIRPGARASDVHAAAVKIIDSGGWNKPLLHRTGRGIGYSDSDGLELKAGSATILKEGMVMTVEPGLYVKDVGGARFGDTVLVTSGGHEILTPFQLGRDI